MNSFADGLQLARLHPPNIIVFLQGLPRRVDDQLVQAAVSPGPVHSETALRAMHDELAKAAIALKKSGFSPDHSIEDFATPAIRTDPELTRLNAAALEVARRVAGVPDTAWSQQPDLLDFVRQCCADVAEHLSTIGDDAEPDTDGTDDTTDWA